MSNRKNESEENPGQQSPADSGNSSQRTWQLKPLLQRSPEISRDRDSANAENKNRKASSAAAPGRPLQGSLHIKKRIRETTEVFKLQGLTQFIVGSGAVGLAVGLIVGGCIKDIVDSFTNAFISPLIALAGGARELQDMTFHVNSSVFEYGRFLGVLIETFFTLLFVYDLVVIPMNMFTSFKYGPLVKCVECQTWIKESARKCPNCCSLQHHNDCERGNINNNNDNYDNNSNSVNTESVRTPPPKRMENSDSFSDEITSMRC